MRSDASHGNHASPRFVSRQLWGIVNSKLPSQSDVSASEQQLAGKVGAREWRIIDQSTSLGSSREGHFSTNAPRDQGESTSACLTHNMASTTAAEVTCRRPLRRSRFGCRNCKLRKVKVGGPTNEARLAARAGLAIFADHIATLRSATKANPCARDALLLGFSATSCRM